MNLAKRIIYGAARAAGLFALARVLTRHRVRILCYHGGSLGDEHQFNPLLFCTGAHLDGRLALLESLGFNWVSLSDAVDMLKGGKPRPRLPVVVTMDDGWHSTAAVLGPVIEKHGVPAALYLCTGHFLSGAPVPDVSIGYMLWKRQGTTIQLSGLHPDLDGRYSLADSLAHRSLFQRAIQWVNEAAVEDRVRRLERLGEALGISTTELDLDSRRFSYMNSDAVVALRAQRWSVDLHGHEHHYPAGDPEALAADLQRCQAAFAATGLDRGLHYCYPSGSHDEAAQRLLRLHQVESATTCLPGLCPENDPSALYYLPRFLDGANISRLVFEAEMSGFADGVRWMARLFSRAAGRAAEGPARAPVLSARRT